MSSRVNLDDLKDMVAKVGKVLYGSAHGDEGKNKAVLCFGSEKEAKKCADKFDGHELKGRDIDAKFVEKDEWAEKSEEKEENGDRSGSESPKKAEKKSQDRDTSRSPKKRSRRDRSSRSPTPKRSHRRSRTRSRSRTPKRRSRRSRS